MIHPRSFDPAPSSFLDEAVVIVRAAGAMIRAEFHREGGPRAHGPDKAPIDIEVESFLREHLLELHPCDWHGEELPQRSQGHADRWVVDPQDGTRSFLKRLRGPAISVALLREERPILAIVFAPTAPDDDGDLFAWAEGLPATRNGVALPPLPTGRSSLDASAVVAMNETAGDYALANHRAFAPAGMLAVPSIAYRLALAAAGEADVAVSIAGGLDSYDVAAGHALLEAVGGRALQLNGRPLLHARGACFQGCVGGLADLVEEAVRRVNAISRTARVPRNRARPKHRLAEPDRLSRAQGVLLGQCVGDALGAQVEFSTPAEIRRLHPGGVTELRPGGTWGLIAGQITDDTEMALALARSLVAEGGFRPDAVGRAYVAWGDSHPLDIGTTTRMGLSAIEGRGRPNLDSQANGALMRVSPIGIAAGRCDRAADWARQDAMLTHPNPICVEASAVFAAAIAAGLAGAGPREMWRMAVDSTTDSVVGACLLAAREGGPKDATRHQGWVLVALWNAFHRLLSGRSFEVALVETVGMGGDTDTNAAICGALLEAAQGREAIPLRWRRQILGCRPVAMPGVRHPRPTACWTDDALELAEALVTCAD